MNPMGVSIAIITLVTFYGFLYYVFISGNGIKYLKDVSLSAKIMYLLVLCFTIIFVFIVVKQNKFIYYWDYGNYWTKSVSFLEIYSSNPLNAIKNAYVSINNDEYNDLLPLLICLPLKIVGITYTRFVLLTHIMFLIPTFIVIITCINKIFMLLDESLLHSTKSIVLSSLVCLLPTLYFAMFRGYIDVAILLPISLIILLTIDITLTQYQKGSFSKDIVLGILLVIVLLFRRYSAFFVVGYVGSLGVIAFIELIKINNKLENFKNVLKHFCTIGFTSLGILILFFNKFIINAIGTNYAAQYVAYDAPLTVKTEDLISRFGLIIFLLIFAAGIITPLVYKKLANLVYFLLISIFLSVVFFFKVQLMGEHHVYVITIQLLLLSVIGLAEFLLIFKKNRCIIPLVLILLYICNFIYCYVPKNSISDSKLFCTKYIPFVRNDISEIEKLVSYLNTFSKEGKAVYVAASGTTLNCDIVRSVYKPYTLNAVPTLLASSDIDLRDGFPISFLDADIIVTTDPIELHAAEGTQEVVRFLSQEVMNHDSIIGKCFEYSNSFMLDNNVTAQVYIRIKDFTAEEVTYIMSYYDQYYPDYKELFKNRLEEYLTTISH